VCSWLGDNVYIGVLWRWESAWFTGLQGKRGQVDRGTGHVVGRQLKSKKEASRLVKSYQETFQND
jgi:hypothetical protein